MRSSQEGMALVTVLVIVLVITAGVLGSITYSGRMQQQIHREGAVLDMKLLGDSVIERAIKMFKDYANERGEFPKPDGSGCEPAGVAKKDCTEQPNVYEVFDPNPSVSFSDSGDYFRVRL